jgi:hypothetical protein
MQCQELNPPVPCKVHLPSLLAAVIAVLLAFVVLLFVPPAAAADHNSRLAKLAGESSEARPSLFSLFVPEGIDDLCVDGRGKSGFQQSVVRDSRPRQVAA